MYIGLDHYLINGMKKLWRGLDKKTLQTFAEITAELSPYGNWKNIRNQIEITKSGVLTPIGTILYATHHSYPYERFSHNKGSDGGIYR